MKFLVALSCLLAAATASGVAPVAYSNVVGAPVAYSNVAAYSNVIASPVAYSTAYNTFAAPITRTVAHVAAPVAHSYTTQTVAAAPVVAATRVAAAPVAHAVATAPVAVAAAPVAVAAPVVQKSQYHAQDELGQASYGHAEPFQAHNAVQDAAGNKVGSYSYVNPEGQVISANYVADALGYRVASNALPVAPAVVPVAPADTPEVAAARAAHLSAHALVKSRARRGIAYTAPVVHSAYAAPVVHSAYAAPVVHSAYAAPVLRAATLSTVVNTPGHAVSYNVY